MKTVVSEKDLEEMFYDNYVEHYLIEQSNGLRERSFSSKIFTSQANFREFYVDDLYIGFGDLNLKQPIDICFESGQTHIQMAFVFSGEIFVKYGRSREEIRIGQNQHNLLFLSEEEKVSGVRADEKNQLKIMDISLTPKLFTQFFPENTYSLQSFFRAMAQNRITALQQDAYPITPAMMRLIKEIMHSQKPSYSQKLFLQARVMELLMLQVEQLQAVQLPTGKQIDKAFQEKMYALKAFLDQQIRANFSIKSLAKQYETNECSLKKGFKATFGYTIFDYWNTQRFDYASNLLKSGKSVQEVAYEMGYNSPQNFSTAFKKRMGYSPKQALQ